MRTVALRTTESPLTSRSKIEFVRRIHQALHNLPRGSVVLVLHPSLAISYLLARRLSSAQLRRELVAFYGFDIWNLSSLEHRIIRRSKLLPFTISDYWAGSLGRNGNTFLIAPGLDATWRDQLINAANHSSRRDDGTVRVLSVFRLESALTKGLRETIQAIELVRESGIRMELYVAGSGALVPDLAAEVSRHEWITIEQNPTDLELANLYAESNVTVLATRTQAVGQLSGEGFGLVLGESQLAGTAVIGPAFGGSSGAYVEGVTGYRPIDESPEALARELHKLSSFESQARMGAAGSAWSAVRFDPEACATRAVEVILGSDQ